MSPRVEAVKRYWETLTPATVANLRGTYTEDASFRDPFHDVRGAQALQRIFSRMFETLEAPRFTIVEAIEEGDVAMLVWDFDFRIKRWRPQVARRIHGTSLLRFAPDGRVCAHRDYWDAAGELYAHLPLIGPLVRAVARALSK